MLCGERSSVQQRHELDRCCGKVDGATRALGTRHTAVPGVLAKVDLSNHHFEPIARRNQFRCFVSLTLYAHPFSSYCQEVLVALYENDVPFAYRTLEDRSARPGMFSVRAGSDANLAVTTERDTASVSQRSREMRQRPRTTSADRASARALRRAARPATRWAQPARSRPG